jgi:hypothetical protein
MNCASSQRQRSEPSEDKNLVNLIGRAFLYAFGGRLEGMGQGERPEPCRQEDYDLLERNRRTKR